MSDPVANDDLAEYQVWFTQSASAFAEVKAEDPEDAIDRAWNKLPGPLCHQCAGKVDMAGDWEPDVVYADGEEVWTR
ncbi:hypothetical protein [Mycobacterium phage WXIN]|nr:hypothetical protein [Mycobacterium phage WXIN]